MIGRENVASMLRHGLQPLLRGCRAFSDAADKVFRRNEITGNWVVYATARRGRPKQTHFHLTKQYAKDLPEVNPDCPFCVGNEATTPPSILQYPPVNSARPVPGEWGLRVVANKFPAVTPICEDKSNALDFEDFHCFRDSSVINDEIMAAGHHEVCIESPRHNHIAALGSQEQLRLLLRAWQERMTSMCEDQSVRYVTLFKNQGGASGASLLHPHSQIVALPIIPSQIDFRLNIARDFYRNHGLSVFARAVEEEEAAGGRVICSNEHFLCFVPFASICPFETWILPRRHLAHYHRMNDVELDAYAAILHEALKRLNAELDEPHLNLVVSSAPVPDRARAAAYNYDAFYSWHTVIIPRLGAGAMAGFEFGTGIFSNGNCPNADAKALREVSL